MPETTTKRGARGASGKRVSAPGELPVKPAGRGRARKLAFQVTLSASVFPELFAELSKMPARDRSLACLRLADRGVGVRWASLLGTVNPAMAAPVAASRGKAPSDAAAGHDEGAVESEPATGRRAQDRSPRSQRESPSTTPHSAVQDELAGFSLG